jgi:hypothetical protein
MHVPGADPARDAIVAKLREQADACVHEDPERRGVMATWTSALECARDTDTGGWSVIVQDDADPLRGWQQHLERACLNSPQPVLGLTHFGAYGRQALAKGAPYGEGLALIWGGAVAYRASLLPGLCAFARGLYESGEERRNDDRVAAAYALKTGHQTAMVARAIFGQPVQKSLIGHNTKVRSPATTIENCEGPPYRTIPRSARIPYNSVRADLERLAAFSG